MRDPKLLVFTDLHIVAEGETIIDLEPIARFEEGLAHALANHGDADQIILLGDLTHFGEPAAYQRLAEALGEVDIPVTLMMGNHDRRAAFLEVFPDTPVTAHGHVQEVIELGDTVLITLDTLYGPPYPEGQNSGYLCEDRLAWLEAQLERARDKRVLLFCHHPLCDVGFPGMDAIQLANAADLLKLLTRFRNVAHIFNGHVHRTIHGSAGGIPFTIFKSPCHQMPLDFQGESSALSVDEPGAYGIILLKRSGVIVHSEDFALAASRKVTQDANSA
ncbi:MAG: phosphodiesterase [Litoreibacter sp.]|nr:phosphodiesterase [Litoreibacter sp.]